MSETPREAYERRLAAARADAGRGRRRGAWVSNLRLAVFAAGAAMAWPVFAARSLDPLWLAAPALAFAVLVVVHDRLLRAVRRDERLVAYFERGLARVEGRWPGTGPRGEEFADPEHLYARDLDLFGPGSLFERLSTARSHAGERTLAEWLLAPASPERVRARQVAVAELRPRLDLRADLASTGEETETTLRPEVLRSWGEAPPRRASAATRLAAALLPIASVSALLAWWLAGAPPLAPAIALAVQGGFGWTLRRRVAEWIREAELPARDLAQLAALLERIETESFRSPLLIEHRGALETGGVPPSRRIRALRTRIDLLDARRNQLFAPIGALLLWTTQLALELERWRSAWGRACGDWIRALGELEALCSLASYSFENPEQPFPELTPDGPRFEGEALGHPLLPGERCVTNDVDLGSERRVWIVSGSNMSGKSTLLRTVGANAVLAFAGAPVRARRLRVSSLALGAALRSEDSLLAGTSRFYAEIQRLRRIVALAESSGGALFLLDEILHGTNSHDRGIGAEAVVRALLERGAIGLVTTHDLALARIADSLAPRALNVHFEDELVDGTMRFDYRLRPGTVERGNALALMRAVGLEV